MRGTSKACVAMMALLVSSGCGDSDATPDVGPPDATAPASVSATATASATASAAATAAKVTPAEKSSWAACAKRIAEVKSSETLPGAPTYETHRVHMARVRGRPALWKQALPRPAKLDRVLKNNKGAPKVATSLRNLIKKTKARKLRRDLLLRRGYLWDDNIHMALALVEQVSLPNLFSESTLFLQRGVEVFELKRAKKTRYLKERYIYVDGPLATKKAEILFGDRVAVEQSELSDETSLSVDLHDLVSRYPVDRLRPLALTTEQVVIDVRYGPGVWVPALFKLQGPKAVLECEVLDEVLIEKKQQFVTEQERLRTAMARVQKAVREMVREDIPFDAETGQTMGFLRKQWKRAYFKGWRSFEYEGKSHRVYDDEGKPIPPQVCIDFLTDTWERASGTWYAAADLVEDPKKGDFNFNPKPERTKGGIDFDQLEVQNRRSVAKFTEFTEEKSELFDVWALPKAERFPFKDRERFFSYLHEKADMFRPGDMLTIHGYKHGGRPHYHSLIVLEQDPITGVIIRVAGNAVFPREQTLEGIMYISPKRSIRHRIRVREPWLDLIAKQPL